MHDTRDILRELTLAHQLDSLILDLSLLCARADHASASVSREGSEDEWERMRR
jgi:hypothetical protein